jgi:hypothetical protein
VRDQLHRQVDAAVSEWRQGDCVVAEQWFIHRTDLDSPLGEDSVQAVQEGADAVEAPVPGLVITSQSCDIVRECQDRPFVEVSPLIEVGPGLLEEIKKARRPQFGYVPGVADQNLVADLDRTMTIEKSVVAKWGRVTGCMSADDRRRFAAALARKRARFPFPDSFNEFVAPLANRLKEKHDKNSPEGEALRALREIRVRAAPSWDSDEIELTFLFLRDEVDESYGGRPWHEHLEKWLYLIPSRGPFHQVYGDVQTLDDISARDYIESDPLDLDHLSRPAPLRRSE